MQKADSWAVSKAVSSDLRSAVLMAEQKAVPMEQRKAGRTVDLRAAMKVVQTGQQTAVPKVAPRVVHWEMRSAASMAVQ